MWVPVAVLAALALVAGLANVPPAIGWLGSVVGFEHFSEWLHPLLFQVGGHEAVHHAGWTIEHTLMVWANIWAGSAMALAWWIYKVDPGWSKAKAFVARFPSLFRWVHNKYFVDEFYEAAFIGPCKQLGAQLWAFDSWVVDGAVNGAARATLLWAKVSNWFDAHIVDGLVNLVAWILQELSGGFKGLQTGRVQNYAYVMFLGFIAFALFKFLV
jgi:NADH-quinone oxidoreductase subunit L